MVLTLKMGDGGLDGPQNKFLLQVMIMGQLVDLVFKENEGGNVKLYLTI